MGKKTTIKLVLHFPQTESDRQELANRVAQIHADSILERIKSLDCPREQKLQLLDTIIADAKQKMAERK